LINAVLVGLTLLSALDVYLMRRYTTALRRRVVRLERAMSNVIAGQLGWNNAEGLDGKK